MKQMIWSLILLSCTAWYPAYADTLTLQQCLSKAATGNYALRVAAHDEKIAAEQINIARGGFLPRVDLQGGYTAQLEPQSIELAGRSVATQDAAYPFFGISIYQTIIDFGRTSSRYERAEAARGAISFNYASQEKNVFLQVVSAYFAILQEEKVVTAAEEEVDQMADHLRVAKNLYEQGVVTRNDLLQAEVRLSNSRQRVLEEANRLKNRWLYLNYLIGQPADYNADLEEFAMIEPPIPAKEARFEARPEIKAMKKVLEASELDVKESKSWFYPEMFARMGMDYAKNSHVKEQAIMAATIGLKFNVFDGGASTSRYREAMENRSKNEAAFNQLQAEIRLEYMTADNDAVVALERIKAAVNAIRQGEENLRINRDRYQAQVGTATDVIDAQTLLTQTKTDLYRALFDYQVALARVKKSLGEL